jgi:hypothetical protein
MDPINEWIAFLAEVRRALVDIAESVEREAGKLRDEQDDVDEGGEA